MPLAIAYPHCEFVLIDSTQKKLAAIQAMVEQLELTNVRTLHARAPHDFVIDDPTATSVASLSNALPLSSLSASSSPLDLPLHSLQKYSFDVCVGRSVAAVPTFCFWILPLLKKETGRLLYMTGGDIPSDWSQCALQKPTVPFLLLQSNEKPNIPITAINEMAATTSTNEDSSSSSIIEKSRLEKNSPTTQEEELYYDEINNAEDEMGSSEKRVLVFSHSTVVSLAETSGEKLRLPIQPGNDVHLDLIIIIIMPLYDVEEKNWLEELGHVEMTKLPRNVVMKISNVMIRHEPKHPINQKKI